MTFKAIFWAAVAVIVLVILPIGMAMSAWQHMTAKKRGDQRKSSGAGIGNVLQELDRLVARPSVEFTLEAESPILKREDDQGGK